MYVNFIKRKLTIHIKEKEKKNKINYLPAVME